MTRPLQERLDEADRITNQLGRPCTYVDERRARERYRLAASPLDVGLYLDPAGPSYRPSLDRIAILGDAYAGSTQQAAFDAMRPDMVTLVQRMAFEGQFPPLTDNGPQPIPSLIRDGDTFIHDAAGEGNLFRWSRRGLDQWQVVLESVHRHDEMWPTPDSDDGTALQALNHFRGYFQTLATWLGEPFGLVDSTPPY